jgi:hypothetical protein
MTAFQAETYHNQYLPAGATSIDAIMSVTSKGAGSTGDAPPAAEIVILDVSGSMGGGTRKLTAAKVATATAIDCIREGTEFGIVAGNEWPFAVYPREGELVPATDQTRSEAKNAVEQLTAGGGTAIGQWLRLAESLFSDDPGAIRHAILLTDGRNEHETPEDLAAAIADCSDRFQCDCRGVGTDWDVDELRRISSSLLGTVDIIRKPAEMEADFQAMMERSMGKATGDVALRIWTPTGAEVAYVAQVQPEVVDLTDRRTDVTALVGDYPTGAWGEETRDYHVRITFPPRAVDDEMLAGRVSLVVADEVVSQALVKVVWTDDLSLSTKVAREVEHYLGQEEAVVAIRDGIAALEAGDADTATNKLTRAREIAIEAGNTGRVAEIERLLDPATRRLRAQIDDADLMELDTRSVRTARITAG